MPEVLPATPSLWKTVIREGWLRDADWNWKRGFGEGHAGILHITEELASLMTSEDPNLAMFGLYESGILTGFFSAEYLGGHTCTVKLSPYRIDSDEAMMAVLGAVFENPPREAYHVHRVEMELPSMDEEEIRRFRNFGFRQEGLFRDRLIRDGARFDTVLLALLRSKWRALQAAERKKDQVN